MKKGTLIEVEWLDAGIDTGDLDPDPVDYDAQSQGARSIGYFVKQGPINLILASDCYPANSTPYRTAQRIPIALIKAVWVLSRSRKKHLLQKRAK